VLCYFQPATSDLRTQSVGSPTLLEDCSGLHLGFSNDLAMRFHRHNQEKSAGILASGYGRIAAKRPQVKDATRIVLVTMRYARVHGAFVCESVSRSYKPLYISIIPGASLWSSHQRNESE
jgi:hypothetical protein